MNNTANLNYQDDFFRMRPRLFALAYKMTKSVVDAEDVVQESFVAMASVKAGTIRAPEAYFVRVVTTRCLQLLDRRKGTLYPGPDLPEPLDDAYLPQAVDEDLSYGLLVVLQRLNPPERAVFILRESFGIDYGAIAEIVESSADNCRQLLHRAKQKLNQPVPALPTSKARLMEMLQVFLAAANSGDLSSLVTWLQDDVTIYADGGGKRSAALRPVVGKKSVLKYMIGIYTKFSAGLSLSVENINSEAAVVLHDRNAGLTDSVTFFSFTEGKLAVIYTIRNPEKLKSLQPRQI